jgi:hypothetical protein
VADVREELALEAIRLEQADVGLCKLVHLQIQALVHRAQLRLALLHAIEHRVEGIGELLELVARPHFGANREVALLHALGRLAKLADRPEDDARQDQVEREHGGEHASKPRGDDVHLAREQLPLGESVRLVDDEESRDWAGVRLADRPKHGPPGPHGAQLGSVEAANVPVQRVPFDDARDGVLAALALAHPLEGVLKILVGLGPLQAFRRDHVQPGLPALGVLDERLERRRLIERLDAVADVDLGRKPGRRKCPGDLELHVVDE